MEGSESERFLAKHGLITLEEPAPDLSEFENLGEQIRTTLAELGHTDVSDEQFMEIAQNCLAHFGVKGMRWGHRKDRPGVVGKTAATSGGLQPGKPGADGAMRRTVIGKDGKPVPLSKDGELVYNAALKLQNGGFGTLTNAEIKAYTDRIKLEDELVKTLQPPAQPGQQNNGRPAQKTVPQKVIKFIGDTLTNEAGKQSARVLNIVATNKINQELEKRGVELPNKGKKKK